MWLCLFVRLVHLMCLAWLLIRLAWFDSSNVCISSSLLVVYDSSNVIMCRLLVVWLDVLVVYVSMYEGRANYQYYALQGSE